VSKTFQSADHSEFVEFLNFQVNIMVLPLIFWLIKVAKIIFFIKNNFYQKNWSNQQPKMIWLTWITDFKRDTTTHIILLLHSCKTMLNSMQSTFNSCPEHVLIMPKSSCKFFRKFHWFYDFKIIYENSWTTKYLEWIKSQVTRHGLNSFKQMLRKRFMLYSRVEKMLQLAKVGVRIV